MSVIVRLAHVAFTLIPHDPSDAVRDERVDHGVELGRHRHPVQHALHWRLGCCSNVRRVLLELRFNPEAPRAVEVYRGELRVEWNDAELTSRDARVPSVSMELDEQRVLPLVSDALWNSRT